MLTIKTNQQKIEVICLFYFQLAIESHHLHDHGNMIINAFYILYNKIVKCVTQY